MKKIIDQHLIKISGKSYIEKKLSMGEDIELKIKGNVVKKEIYDNQDGSVNVCYTIKPILVFIDEKNIQ